MRSPDAPEHHSFSRFALAVCACVVALPGVALGAAGAVSAVAPTGGESAPGSPKIAAASCANQQPWTCARGQVLTINGTDLRSARTIVFLGEPGQRDDVHVRVRARAAARGELLTLVPMHARSGRIRIVASVGRPALSATRLRVLEQLPPVDDAEQLQTLVAGGRTSARFEYTTTAPLPEGSAIEAVRVPSGQVVHRWALETNSTEGEVRWDGFAGDEPAPTGTYVLRANSTAAATLVPSDDADREFDLIAALFPIRGQHRTGLSAMQRFGGPRGHGGQDVFARCGTPLAALSRGTVQFAGFQGAAGNYVVVGLPSGESYAYMHLREPALVERGDRVFTGQRLGLVGQTGHADGCHLHIELWTAPGWYRGGHAYDPIASLQHWDAWS